MWRASPEAQTECARQSKKIGHESRQFINDDYEAVLGNYNDNVLSRIRDCADILARNELTLQLDLGDCYDLRTSWNVNQGGHQAHSPYAADGEYGFYQMSKYQEAYLQRIKHIVQNIKDIPNLRAVTIANEPAPPNTEDGEEVFQAWMARMAMEIKGMIPDKQVLAGVADPRYIKGKVRGLDVNTVHFYEGAIEFGGLDDFLARSPLPVLVQEWGVPKFFMGMPMHENLDRDQDEFLRKVIATVSQVDYMEKRVDINVTGLGVWCIDAVEDGFLYEVEKMPKTNEDLARFDRLMR